MKIDENWVKLDEIDENCAKVKVLCRLSCRGNLGTSKKKESVKNVTKVMQN